MIMAREVNDLLNKQICDEFSNYFMYYSMGNWFAEKNLNGFVKLFYKYADEELDHAMRLTKHVTDNNGYITAPRGGELCNVKLDYQGVSEIFEYALNREMETSANYNVLKDKVLSFKDYTTSYALDWFINEQIEEEEKIRNLIARLESGSVNPIIGVMNSSFEG